MAGLRGWHNRAVAFTYSTDNPTDVHRLRLLIADTTEKDSAGVRLYVYEDEELQTMLDLNAGVLLATAAMALRTRIADLAQTYTVQANARGSGVTISSKDSVAALQALADKYDERAAQSAPAELHDWSAADLNDLEALLGPEFHRAADEAAGVEFAG